MPPQWGCLAERCAAEVAIRYTATMSVLQNITNAEQLLGATALGRCELVCGELIRMNPAGFLHGRVVGRVTSLLESHVRQNKLGALTGAETGFLIATGPDTVRAPDVGFVRAERVEDPKMEGFFRGAPDLAVEVLSPSDRASDVLAKVQDWLSSGCRAVWVIDPARETVSAYRGEGQAVVLSVSDELAGGDVLPGWTLRVAELFAE